MINPFDYLYYKLYKAWSHLSFSGIPTHHTGIMSLLLTFNVYSIYTWIFKAKVSITVFMIFAFFVVITILFCYRTKVENKIIEKFDKESKTSRIVGSLAIILYAILSVWGFSLVLKYY